jgi:hypothetical protein
VARIRRNRDVTPAADQLAINPEVLYFQMEASKLSNFSGAGCAIQFTA